MDTDKSHASTQGCCVPGSPRGTLTYDRHEHSDVECQVRRSRVRVSAAGAETIWNRASQGRITRDRSTLFGGVPGNEVFRY